MRGRGSVGDETGPGPVAHVHVFGIILHAFGLAIAMVPHLWAERSPVLRHAPDTMAAAVVKKRN